MSAPAIVITLPLEGPLQVTVDCLNESEWERLRDWLDSRPGLHELVGQALELHDEAAA